MSLAVCVFTYADNPSGWAVNNIQSAKEMNIVNSYFEGNYQKTITRGEFCRLAVLTLDKWNIEEKKIENSIEFSDTNDRDIVRCAKLGIVSGMGNNKFEPDLPITREQAAKMLYNTLNLTPALNSYKEDNKNGVNGIFLPHLFGDGKYISNWARNEIYAMYHLGVMLGTDNDNFSPKGNYTIEQAICTFLRLYNTYTAPDKVSRPEAELYPDSNTANRLSQGGSKDSYCLNSAYEWRTDEYKYEPEYYDGFGNVYSAEDKGYVYPLSAKYMEVIVSAGAGVGSSVLIDKNCNEVLEPFYAMLASNDEKAAVIPLGFGKCQLYNIDTKEIIKEYDFIQDIGCGIYCFNIGDKRGYMNTNFEKVMDAVYKPVSQNFLNDLCIFQKQDNSFIIVNTKGKILKSFKLDLNRYDLNGIFGTNMMLTDKKANGTVLYRAYSGKYIKDYPIMWFTSMGEIIVQKNGKKYILDKEGNVKVNLDALGYDDIDEYVSSGFYAVFKIDKSNWGRILPADIMDYNGNIIRKGVSSFGIYCDYNGLSAYKSGERQLTVFDNYGKDIGVVNVSEDIDNFKFINGLIFVNSSDDNKYYTRYYTPTGEAAVTNCCSEINKEEY